MEPFIDREFLEFLESELDSITDFDLRRLELVEYREIAKCGLDHHEKNETRNQPSNDEILTALIACIEPEFYEEFQQWSQIKLLTKISQTNSK